MSFSLWNRKLRWKGLTSTTPPQSSLHAVAPRSESTTGALGDPIPRTFSNIGDYQYHFRKQRLWIYFAGLLSNFRSDKKEISTEKQVSSKHRTTTAYREQTTTPLHQPSLVKQDPCPSHNEPTVFTQNAHLITRADPSEQWANVSRQNEVVAGSGGIAQTHELPVSSLGALTLLEIPDLTEQVVQTSLYPVFEGVFSNLFIGDLNGYKVAIKVVRGVGTLHATRRRLNREKQVWGSLNHQNILPLYGYCEGFGEFGALISPWYAKGNVGSCIRRHSVSVVQRFDWLCEIIDGVVYLHSRDPIVIHGDLKPLNVLIDDDGHARICDFGLVRSPLIEQTTTSHNGTLRYRARELVNTEECVHEDEHGVVTTASDMYAVGCMALELLFLRLPYAEYGTSEQVFMAIHRGIPPIKGIPVTGTPPLPIKHLWKVLKLCWSKNPKSRPSALQLQEYMSIHKSSILASLGEEVVLPSPV